MLEWFANLQFHVRIHISSLDRDTIEPGHYYACVCTACTQGDIRLVAGSAANEGRVEICNNNMWGSVCDQGWDINDARVACRHAGYSGGATSEYSNRALPIYIIIYAAGNF